MDFTKLFDVFSRRSVLNGIDSHPLTPQFKYRFAKLCAEYFSNNGFIEEFWWEIKSKFEYLEGGSIAQGGNTLEVATGVLAFLEQCDDKKFLDFVELVFKLEHLPPALMEEHPLVRSVNQFFELDGLPYALTDFSWEEIEETEGWSSGKSYRLSTYPQVVLRESEVVYQNAILPLLTLLRQAHFSTANEEFLKGLADFRNGDHEDCVVKCVSAFESVLKVICQRKGWSYSQSDTAKALVPKVLGKTSLEEFYREPLVLVADIRNRQSSAHGGGDQPKRVPKHVANYVINSTAAAILLLVQEANL